MTITDEMVEVAVSAWLAYPRIRGGKLQDSMRAALEAAERVRPKATNDQIDEIAGIFIRWARDPKSSSWVDLREKARAVLADRRYM